MIGRGVPTFTRGERRGGWALSRSHSPPSMPGPESVSPHTIVLLFFDSPTCLFLPFYVHSILLFIITLKTLSQIVFPANLFYSWFYTYVTCQDYSKTFSQIEGTFVLEIPKLLLGYSTSSAPLDHAHYGQGHTHQGSGCSHLQLFISLEPPLSSLPPIRDIVRDLLQSRL